MLSAGELAAAMNVEAEKVSSDPNKTREDYILEVAQEGYIPTYPKPKELFLDIDNQQHMEVFLRSWEVLKRNFQNLNLTGEDENYRPKEMVYVQTPSRTPGGYHIRITMPFAMTNMERIAWQASLGSDPVRELLSCIRWCVGDKEPTMLVEKDPNWKKPADPEGDIPF